MYWNDFTVSGNLGADAQINKLASGKTVANFRIASTKRYKDAQGNQKEETSWFRCALFGQSADNIGQYLVKGKGVLVSGEVSIKPFESVTDALDEAGNPIRAKVKRDSFEITVNRIQLLGTKGDTEGSPVAVAAGVSDSGDMFGADDASVPF